MCGLRGSAAAVVFLPRDATFFYHLCPHQTNCLYDFIFFSCRESTELFLALGRTCVCLAVSVPGEYGGGVPKGWRISRF